MKKKNSTIILLVILNLILLISLFLSITNNNKIFTLIYWFDAPITIFINLYLIRIYIENSLNIDKEKSNNIIRSFSNITTVTSIIYIAIFLFIMLYSKVENLLIINYIQVLFCIITIAYEIVYDSSIIKAKRETKELIDKKYNKK